MIKCEGVVLQIKSVELIIVIKFGVKMKKLLPPLGYKLEVVLIQLYENEFESCLAECFYLDRFVWREQSTG